MFPGRADYSRVKNPTSLLERILEMLAWDFQTDSSCGGFYFLLFIVLLLMIDLKSLLCLNKVIGLLTNLKRIVWSLILIKLIGWQAEQI